MTSEAKKDVEVKVPEHPKEKKRDASDFQSIYDKIITKVTKAGEKE